MDRPPLLARVFRRRVVVRALAAGIGLVMLAGVVLLRPLPGPVLRWALVRSAPVLLTDVRPDSTTWSGRVQGIALRAWSNLLSFSLVQAYLDAQPSLPDTLGDVEFMVARLVPLRRLLLSQNELAHPAHDWLAFASGIGYCDQLNRVGAMVLAKRFAHPQTFSVSAADGANGHVIGRVWSMRLGDWLYFDVWPANVAVFRYHAGAGVEMLARSCDIPERDVPGADHIASGLYERIPYGSVLNEYTATFAAYVWSRLLTPARDIGTSVAAELAASAAPTGASGASGASVPVLTTAQPVSSEVARAYMRHRLDLVLRPSGSAQPMVAMPSTRPGDMLLETANTLFSRKVAAPHVPCDASSGMSVASRLAP